MTKSTDIAVGKLSEIMSAQATIAMPEVISVFISKYETDLYNRKSELTIEIGNLKKDLEMLQASTLAKADFSSYDEIKISKLGLVTYITEPKINWDDGKFTCQVGLREDETRGKDYRLDKQVIQDIPKSFLKQHEALKETLRQTTDNLQDILAKISDMSRKERQVKARISELRLKEQGLEDFLQDKEMQKLIAI